MVNNMFNKDDLFLALDVESYGLYGTTISFGAILFDIDGNGIETRYCYSEKQLKLARSIIYVNNLSIQVLE